MWPKTIPRPLAFLLKPFKNKSYVKAALGSKSTMEVGEQWGKTGNMEEASSQRDPLGKARREDFLISGASPTGNASPPCHASSKPKSLGASFSKSKSVGDEWTAKASRRINSAVRLTGALQL